MDDFHLNKQINKMIFEEKKENSFVLLKIDIAS